jgi:hypothetical protein
VTPLTQKLSLKTHSNAGTTRLAAEKPQLDPSIPTRTDKTPGFQEMRRIVNAHPHATDNTLRRPSKIRCLKTWNLQRTVDGVLQYEKMLGPIEFYLMTENLVVVPSLG